MSAKLPDMLGAIRASADGALKRLSGRAEAPQTPAPTARFHTPDPTRTLFPNETEAPDGRAPGRLRDLLSESSVNLDRMRELLGAHAGAIAEASADRAAGEKSLTIWGWRAMIGAGWLAAGAWLNQMALQARAADLTTTAMGGLPVADADVLARAFMLAGAAGAAAAIIMIFWVFATGNGDNNRLRRRGEAFGAELGEEVRALSENLKRRRDLVVNGPKSPGALSAASQCHLEGLEICALFGQIPFLTTGDPKEADARYRLFLKRFAPSSAGYSFASMIVMGLLGAVIGVVSGFVGGFLRAVRLYRPEAAAPAAEPVVIAMLQYPLAAQALIFGGLLYLFMGLLIDAFSGMVGRREMARARREALDAMRSAYVAKEAPLETEVVRQVEDVVEILRAQLGVGARAGHADARTDFPRTGDARPNQGTGFSADEDVPEWRRRDSSVKFVATDFAAAPQTFRTDAFAKKFSASGERNTGSKRGGEDLEKGSGG
jgi:hypothetical protein